MAMGDPIQWTSDELKERSTRLTDNLTVARGDMSAPINEILTNRKLLDLTQDRDYKPDPDAPIMEVPFLKESMLALHAEIAPAILNVQPIARYKSFGADDLGKLFEPYFTELLLTHMRAARIIERWFYAGLRDSVSIMMVGWDTRGHTQPTWEVSQEPTGYDLLGRPTGTRQRVKRSDEYRIDYDWPELTLIPIEEFLIYPSRDADIQRSELVGHRRNISGETLVQGMLAGWFDREQCEQLMAEDITAEYASSPADTLFEIGDNMNMHPEDKRNVMTLTECYWRQPGKGQKPATDYQVIIHEPSGIIIRAVPMPWWHGQRPYVACQPYGLNTGLFQDSVASSGAAQVQNVKTEILNLVVDAARYGVRPPMLVAASIYARVRDTLEENMRPNGLIPFPDQYFTAGGRTVQPWNAGYNPSSLLSVLEYIDQAGQKPTGATDVIKAMPTPNMTATQAQQIMESSKRLLGLLVEHCARDTSDLFQLIHEVLTQFAGHETLQTLWQQVNVNSQVTLEQALAGQYVVVANGITETNNKAIIAQRAGEIFGVLQNEQFVMTDPQKRHKLMEYVLNSLGYRDPAELLGTKEEWVQKAMAQLQVEAIDQQMGAVQAQMGAEQQAMSPGGGANGAGA